MGDRAYRVKMPIDLVDVFGAAVVDVFRRVGLMLGCLLGASGMAAFGLADGEMVVDQSLDPELIVSAMVRGFWLFFYPLASGWAILYIPSVVGMMMYYTKAYSLDSRLFFVGWLVFAELMCLSASRPSWFDPSLFAMITGATGVSDPDRAELIWRWVGFGVIAGCGGFFIFLAHWMQQHKRSRAEAHLMGVAVENAQRREATKRVHDPRMVADEDP